MSQHEEVIEITSLFGAHSRKGLVQLRWGEKVAQLTFKEACRHALTILEAAANAEVDEELANVMQYAGASLSQVGQTMALLRAAHSKADGYLTGTMNLDQHQCHAIEHAKLLSLFQRVSHRLPSAIEGQMPGRGAELGAMVAARLTARLGGAS